MFVFKLSVTLLQSNWEWDWAWICVFDKDKKGDYLFLNKDKEEVNTSNILLISLFYKYEEELNLISLV